MDDFWNESETVPSNLDDFFDDETDTNSVVVKGSNRISDTTNVSSFNDIPSISTSVQENKPKHKSTLSSGSLSSILDNISIHSDSALSGISGSTKVVGKALGEKIESWKPSSVSSFKRKNEIGQCLNCSSKNEEIIQLKKRLERSYSRHALTLSPSESVRRLLVGSTVWLEGHRSAEDKRALLDAAVASADTSTIVAILIFIRKTLKKSGFLKEILRQPEAAQAYVHYLRQRMETSEALEILGLLGRTEEAALYRLELCLNASSQEAQLKKINEALATHFAKPELAFEASILEQHRDILQLQSSLDARDQVEATSNAALLSNPPSTRVWSQPLLTTLFYCSMYHWGEPANRTESPLALRLRFKIPDAEFLWTVLRARARMRHWPLPDALGELVQSKGLMGTLSTLGGFSGGAKTVRSLMPIARVVDTLATSGAPPDVLSAYINLLSSNEDKLKVALAYKCHLAVIEAYVALRERQGLQDYISRIPAGSVEYVKADLAIKNTKWK